ncbi:recombinase family protein [Actinomadura coerulea]|uniref:recombinase family protein n=1 Tax=Actinomadura coerulea TaxID=46159 RepID=UPI00342DE11B
MNAHRPELNACHTFIATSDTLVVPSLDRYGRSLHDLITMVAELRQRDIGFTSLHENLDTTTLGGRLVSHVFAVLAEFHPRAHRSRHLRGPGRRARGAGSAVAPPSSTRTCYAPPGTRCPTRGPGSTDEVLVGYSRDLR